MTPAISANAVPHEINAGLQPDRAPVRGVLG